MKKRLLAVIVVLALVATLTVGCKGDEGQQGGRGPAGPQGAAGAQGEVGPQGEAGLKGASGTSGSQGEQGPQGEIGPEGEKGPRGAGARGATGAKGATGARGATGPAGSDANYDALEALIDELDARIDALENLPVTVIGLETCGDGVAEWSTDTSEFGTSSVKLHVADGAVDWAQVSIPVDIAIGDITELTIWEYIEPFESPAENRELKIYLGIDADGDGDFEADVYQWLSDISGPDWGAHDPAHLHGDTFILDWEIHSATSTSMPAGEWIERDILAGDKGVITPTEDGVRTAARYDATIDPSFDSGIPALITRLTLYPNMLYDDIPIPYCFIAVEQPYTGPYPERNPGPARVEAGDRVKVIEVWIGRSASWVDATVYVDDLTINGVTYSLEPPSLLR